MKQVALIIGVICVSIAYGQETKSGRVQMHNGRPTIFVNERPVLPMIYALTDVPGGRWTWEEVPRYNLKSFCNLGVNLIQVDLAFDHVWKEDGTLVLDTAQRQLKGILDVCPDASIFIRFHVNPPKWWQLKHQDENTVYADTQAKPDIDFGIQRIIEDDEETPTRHSLASEKWKKECGEKLSELLKTLSNTPEAKSVVGIQVAGGVYGEWHYWGFIENEPDISEPMQRYFRQWLQNKYKTNKALQTAWIDPSVTFENATVPDTVARYHTQHGIFRDPLKERKTIDYYEAQHECVVDAIIYFSQIVKESWPRPIVTGAFYGYFYSVFGREAAGGHLQLQKLLQSKYVDYLSAPGTYYPNAVEMGEPYRSRSLIHSMTLHGKLWLDEMDQQPPLVPLKDKAFQEGLQKSIAQVRRNVLFTLSKGHGLWFYDFGPSGFNGGQRLADHGSWGWWDEPSLRKDIKALKEIIEKNYHATTYRSSADVLLVHDTKSYLHMGSHRRHAAFMHWTNNWPMVSIFKSGAVHDVIHVDDLSLVDINQYKTVVFVNTVVLDNNQKKIIKTKVARDGRHLVWIYAPGYSDGQTLNPKFIEEMTGFKIFRDTTKATYVLNVDSTVVRNVNASIFRSTFSPAFSVIQTEGVHSLGILQPGGGVGFARRATKDFTSWFIAIPPNDAAFWRYIFKASGAHIFSEHGDVIYEGLGLLTLHCKQSGERKITLRNGQTLNVQVNDNSTLVINASNGQVMLR
jgi:hypothetical protein